MKKLFNNQIKMIKSLQNKKSRSETGLFIAEGIKTVRELLKSDIKMEMLVFDPGFDEDIRNEMIHLNRSPEIYEQQIESVSEMVSSEGVLAVGVLPESENADIFFRNKSNLLGLFSINDPGNLGTLIRTGKWFGIDGIVLYGDCADVFSPKVIRSSMGAIFGAKFIYFKDFQESREQLKGHHKIGTFLNKSSSFTGVGKSKMILFLGNEANGIDQSLEAEFDSNFRIPSEGDFESLNVSVAGGILMYEIFNSRRGKKC